jgi:hypothetical protein
MLWDCPRCDTPKLLGLSHRNCPNCGAPQDPATRYFPDDADKVAVEDHPFVGADKQCPGCEAPNAATATFCVGCGGSLDGAGPVVKRASQTEGDAGFEVDSSQNALAEQHAQKRAAQAARSAPDSEPPKNKTYVGVGIAIAAVLVLIGIGIAAMLWKKDAGVVVSGHSWSRSIAVEQLRTVEESAWKDSVPTDARGVNCVEEQRSTNKVADGQDCHTVRHDNADGTFSESEDCTTKYREEPVFDQRCTYSVDRWKQQRIEQAGAEGLTPEPSWPSVVLTGAGLNALGSEREGTRSEKYTVKFKEDGPSGRLLTCDIAQSQWQTLADGTRWIAPVGVVSDSIDCSGLKAP